MRHFDKVADLSPTFLSYPHFYPQNQWKKSSNLYNSHDFEKNQEALIMSEDRLTRMEDKLDKLSEAVLAIARMEERMLTVFKRLENVDGSIKKMDDRIDEMEKQAITQSETIRQHCDIWPPKPFRRIYAYCWRTNP